MNRTDILMLALNSTENLTLTPPIFLSSDSDLDPRERHLVCSTLHMGSVFLEEKVLPLC